MSHDLNNKYTSMRCSCCMDAVNGICCDLQSALEAKGHICTPDIIINGLRKMDDIQAFLAEKIGGFLRSVSAEDHKTVKTELLVSLFHGLNLIQDVLIGLADRLERAAAGSQHRAAGRQNSGEILSGQTETVRSKE